MMVNCICRAQSDYISNSMSKEKEKGAQTPHTAAGVVAWPPKNLNQIKNLKKQNAVNKLGCNGWSAVESGE